jgi:hypothetical protein
MAIVRAVTEELAGAYHRHEMYELARHERNNRFSATMALVTLHGEHADITLVGDSGIRLNGERVMQVEKDLDLITSTLRQQAWPVIAEVTDDVDLRETLSRQITWHGTRQALDALSPHIDASHLARIEERSLAANAAKLPHVPMDDIRNLVTGGIVNAQGGYQNEAGMILGYSCLDGFSVPESLVYRERIDRNELKSIELFSDGYFTPGSAFGVSSWESRFAEIERADPHKVVSYLSPKGSTRDAFADDRTYLGIRW